MTGAIFSTIVVCVAFGVILVWAFRPASKALWEQRGSSIFDADDAMQGESDE